MISKVMGFIPVLNLPEVEGFNGYGKIGLECIVVIHALLILGASVLQLKMRMRAIWSSNLRLLY
jgi:hypothetical protein